MAVTGAKFAESLMADKQGGKEAAQKRYQEACKNHLEAMEKLYQLDAYKAIVQLAVSDMQEFMNRLNSSAECQAAITAAKSFEKEMLSALRVLAKYGKQDNDARRDQFYELMRNPDETFVFIKQCLTYRDKKADETAQFIDDALSYITKEHFAALIPLATAEIKREENGVTYSKAAARSIVERASLQFHELLKGEISNHSRKAYHFVFNAKHLKAIGKDTHHPTWNLPKSTKYFEFGGVLDDNKKNPLCHIVTFDKIPDGLNITGLNKLILGAHFKQLRNGEEENGLLFYKHNQEGNPKRINPSEGLDDFTPLKPAKIALALTPARWLHQEWSMCVERENLFRVGGEPVWSQGEEILVCPHCGAKMDFLAQLDNGLPDTDNDEVVFGYLGMLYIFWCDKCKVSGYITQWDD